MTFCSASRSRATSAFARVMSTEAWRLKTGIVHASVSRLAIVRRTLVSSRRSASPTAIGAGAAAGAASARSTSSATIRPSGPVPRMVERSIPRSRAIRRASGDAFTRPSRAGRRRLRRRLGLRRGLRRLLLSDLLGRLGLRDRELLALLADHADRLADRHLAFLDRDLQQDAGEVGLDLLRHLVRVQLVQRLALLDLVPLGLEPLDDRARLHPLPEPGQLDLASHSARRSS